MTTTTLKRSGNKWTVNEELRLQREYELLGLTLSEIAAKHERSVESIAFKLVEEGFAGEGSEAKSMVKRVLEEKRKKAEQRSLAQTTTPESDMRMTRSQALKGRPAGVCTAPARNSASGNVRREILLKKIATSVSKR